MKENVVKIDTRVKNVTTVRGRDGKTARNQAATSPLDPAPVSDDVRLTSASSKLSEYEAELAGLDVADSGKIETVRQAIADGSFTVDEEAVAEGLIQESIDTITHQAQR
jgi:negative regulator of flagellin synthesis FlgM